MKRGRSGVGRVTVASSRAWRFHYNERLMGPLGESALGAARVGAAILTARFRKLAPGSIDEKARNDFVSAADRESESAIFDYLAKRHPGHALLGEEGGYRRFDGGSGEPAGVWIVDPLDGTANFVHGFPIYAVSVGLQVAGELVAAAVIDPDRGDEWWAEKGAGTHWNGERVRCSTKDSFSDAFVATGFPFRARQYIDPYLALFKDVFLECRALRRAGAAALDLAYVSCGIFDAFFELKLSAWDIAAGALLITEAGGTVTDLDGGGDFLERGSIIAAAPGVHGRLLELSRRHVSESLVDG